MVRAGALLIVGLVVLTWGFLLWRRRAFRGIVRAGWALAVTLWWTELGLTAWWVWRAPAHELRDPPKGVVDRVAGVPVWGDLAELGADGPTVLLVGDSFAYGYGLQAEQTLRAQLQDGLDAAGHTVRVRNHAMSGATFFDELVLFAALGEATGPDVVVWLVVPNDLGLSGIGGHHDGVVDRGQDLSGPLIWAVPRRMAGAPAQERAMLDRYEQATDPDRAPMQHYRRDLATLTQALAARGTRLVVGVFPLLHRLEDYPLRAAHERLLAGARDAGAEVVDLLAILQGRDASDLWVSGKDHHPNAQAVRLAVGALLPAVTAAPLSSRAPSCGGLPTGDGLEALAAAVCAAPQDAEALLALSRALHAAPPPVTGPGSSRLQVVRVLAALAAHHARQDAQRDAALAWLNATR